MRKTKKFLSTLLCGLALAVTAQAGKYNQVINIGDKAPAWKELEGVDGKRHSLADLADKSVVVVAFTCNSCPYAVDVEDRLISVAKRFREKSVAVVAINANKIPADNLAAMKARAEEKGFNFPYLHDVSQQVAKSYGAFYTPEFFVLNKQRQIVYTGSLDDSPDGTNVTKPYVERAISAALQGKRPEVTETVPIGCKVRYEKKRRQAK